MGRKTAFDSKWVVDRKFFDGTTMLPDMPAAAAALNPAAQLGLWGGAP